MYVVYYIIALQSSCIAAVSVAVAHLPTAGGKAKRGWAHWWRRGSTSCTSLHPNAHQILLLFVTNGTMRTEAEAVACVWALAGSVSRKSASACASVKREAVAHRWRRRTRIAGEAGCRSWTASRSPPTGSPARRTPSSPRTAACSRWAP